MTPTRQVKVTINDQTFDLRYPDVPAMQKVVKEVFLKGEYPVLPFLRSDPGVILDIGANIGCATLWFRALYPAATILACEPARDAFALLQANTAPLPNVRIFPCGLHDHDCTMKLYHGVESGVTNSVGASAHNTADFEVVTLRRASTFLAEQGIDRIVLLKLDTEGVEVPILRDLQHLLGRVDAIALEYHSEADRLEIDRMLSPRFALFQGKAHFVHRGALVYVAKEIIASRTRYNQFEIRLAATR
jgi:FkbM family methyltransferase